MARLLTTDQVEARDRLAFWNDAVSDAYVQLSCDAPGGDVVGDIRIDSLATLELSRVTASAQHVHRTPSLIARAAEDRFLVSIQTSGVGRISQDGRTAVLHAGDFALYDSTRPYRLDFDGPFQQYVLMLPGPTLRSQLRDATDLTARSVRGSRGAGHLMIEMIRTLAADIAVLEPAAAAAVAQSVGHIVVAGLSSLGGEAPEPSLEARREQVRAVARARLRDPDLSVAMIAGQLHASVSTLHRAFAGEPCSIAEWIRAQRLDAVRADLCDPGLRHRTIGDLALSWGFVDASHFSRAFRARFGSTAREVRQAGSTTNWRSDRST
ncbi:helix-turn-helix domain-containing protein [Pseudonocardia sp. KRD-184]|uniref:Helix-turn-helix domain-containing protein n=1 Tax=Pseudonocardia oceani TaxID=2792013 RepID=A0ABS6UD04_9PSEU|nr:helix-turn-helix domain-containing protein [Pseudonocardia oceani]MBW0093286.1 helix-turn-helix domain-containing protein [Pseudonocardia oceani]MBW0100053.1 helix-turn-helix domain-containing protein [Pseudonocardia oceani]MBW0112713.1 helix-turn-helix domain-containing protein [Pseudonocardia oceani]MBW0120645.1 helix-turn-helix domain-containing protein [Pseudonocardia oceani]MBW0129838.1 helix-turn-helix domain-containing protein [Pseudonocardia oceani]